MQQFLKEKKGDVPPFWPIYKGERRTTFAKKYRIKKRCCWEHFGEHSENIGNKLGT
jgi:hypothetical protein